MFKFSFQVETEEESSSNAPNDEEAGTHSEQCQNASKQCLDLRKENIDAYPCEELPFLPKKDAVEPDVISTFSPGPEYSIEYLNHLALLDETFTEDIVTAESDHSDLVPNRYEGGLKVWECTFDLGSFLVECQERRAELKGKKVLDLGCGAGILGIEAILVGSSCVHFQDYNKDVLSKLTMVNYDLNCRTSDKVVDPQDAAVSVRFFSGDWGSFTEKHEDTYDFILTSETIYSTQNYSKLLELFDRKLKPDGVVFLAAKTYYFGVGGGVRLFEKAMETDGRFRYDVVWKCDAGVKREILKLSRK